MGMLDMATNRNVHTAFIYNPWPSCLFTAQLTNHLHRAVSVDNLMGSQPLKELSCISWNLKIHYHVHKGPTLVPVLSQINPVHALQFHCRLSSHLHLCLPSGLLLACFPHTIPYTFLFSPMHATCPIHLIILHLDTPVICDEKNKWTFTTCNFPHFLLLPPF